MTVQKERVLKVRISDYTHSELMRHALSDGVSPALVVEIALKKHLGLWSKKET